MIAGIDPGFKGAVVILSDDGKTILDVTSMPVSTKKLRSGKERTTMNLKSLANFLTVDLRFVVVEDVHAMPKQGVAGMFNFGRNVGQIEGVAGALGHQILRVKPEVWKPALGLSQKKDEAIALACRLWSPQSALFRARLGEGKAEAALIAYFASQSILSSAL